MKSLLIVPKKKSDLHMKPVKLDDISHDLDNISVKKGSKSDKIKSQSDLSNEAKSQEQPQNEAKQCNFKEKYFMLVEDRII